MELTVGAVLEGKVKSITNFGAFIALPENKTGMVHISEVANAYVSDIHQHLTEGQDVKVMVIGLDNGKINLSIKRLEPKPQRENAPRGEFRGNGGQRRKGQSSRPNRAPVQPAAPKTADQLFDLFHPPVFRPPDQEQKKIKKLPLRGSWLAQRD